MKNSGIIVAFHTGRGGRFYNAGHVTYIGEKNFQDLQNVESVNLIIRDRDEKGRFCKPYLVDCSGNEVTDDEINAEVGTLDFDGQYDTLSACYIEDCSDSQIELIAEDRNHVKSNDLIVWLKDYNNEWDFDLIGNLLDEVEI